MSRAKKAAAKKGHKPKHKAKRKPKHKPTAHHYCGHPHPEKLIAGTSNAWCSRCGAIHWAGVWRRCDEALRRSHS